MTTKTYSIESGAGSPLDPEFIGEGFNPSEFAGILGFGVITPFRRGANDFTNSGGVAFLQSMISQVLGVACDSDYTQGELPWRTEFGSLVHFIRHKNNDAVAGELARVYVADALGRWVPQIRIKDVTIERKNGPEGAKNILLVALLYDIIGINRPGNEVLIPDVSQTVELAAAA